MTGEFVWAVVPSAGRVAFAFAPVDGGPIRARSLRTDSQARGAQRLGWLDRQLRIVARQWSADWPPAAVWVEEPASGSHLTPAYMAGVVQAAMHESLAVPVHTMAVAAWKLRSVGVRCASEPDVLAWVGRLGVSVRSPGEASATALAYAGRAVLLSGTWEVAA